MIKEYLDKHPFMKIKKGIYRKEKFKDYEETFVSFFDISRRHSGITWTEDTSFEQAVAEFGQFIHPESDISNNSVGVSPKNIANLKDKLKKEFEPFLNRIFPVLNSYASKHYLDQFMSDGYIDWDQIIDICLKFIKEEKNLDIVAGRLFYSFNPTFNAFNSLDEKTIIAIGTLSVNERTVATGLKNGKLKISDTDFSGIDEKEILEKLKLVWIEKKGRVPESIPMIYVNPDNFSKEILGVVESLYGTRQIAKLSIDQQIRTSILIDNFGINLPYIPVDLLKQDFHDLDYTGKIIPDYRDVLKKIKGGNSSFYLNVIRLLDKSNTLKPFILKQQEIKEEDVSTIAYMNNIFSSIKNKFSLDILKNIDIYFFKVFLRYKVNDLNQISRLVSIFEEAQIKKIEMNIPIVKGNVGNYSYEILTKDNPLGLILGYATDCCQVIGHQGEACLVNGYMDPNASFFVVMKDKKIYAQSWVWTRSDTNFGTGFCFDSLEILGKDVDKSPNILSCYKEASKQLIEHYDVVYVGADGSCMPDGMKNKFKKRYEIDEVKKLNLCHPNPNIYSDLVLDNGGCFIIENKKDKNEK